MTGMTGASTSDTSDTSDTEKEEQDMTMKDRYYVQVWPYGVGCGDFTAYAFDTEQEAEKKLEEANTSRATFEEMEDAYGKNFCILPDMTVCSHREAVEINQVSGERYICDRR